MSTKQKPGPWVMRRDKGLVNAYYFVERTGANGKKEHLEYASDGRPMLWGEEQARAAIAKATPPATKRGFTMEEWIAAGHTTD